LGHLLLALHSELKWTLKELQNRLHRNAPLTRIQSDIQRVDELDHRLSASIGHKLQLTRTQLAGFMQHMASLSPTAVLERGYAILTNQAGQNISRVSQVSDGEALNVKVSDGEFGVRVENH
jgi:exodeoxyribonuclease VII large subunit